MSPVEAEGQRALLPPDLVAGHRLVRLLGRGTSGSVYLAQPQSGGTPLALKLCPLPADETAAARGAAFVRSAQAAARLQHPHIVTVHAAGVEARLAWMSMEAVPGTDLSVHTHVATRLGAATAVLTAARIAQALSHAHRHGIVHRDLKPGNVLVHLPSGTVKLADFGLARPADAAQSGTGLLLGTPLYMAPEQLAGNVPTPRSDLYALGVVLFELLAGQPPHSGQTMGELIAHVCTRPALDLAALRPELPPAVVSLVARLLANRALDRPGDARTVAEELTQLADTLPTDVAN